jgi:hypothetical protein
MGIRCFMLDRVDPPVIRLYLRRYSYGAHPGDEDASRARIICPSGFHGKDGYIGGHDSDPVFLRDVPGVVDRRGVARPIRSPRRPARSNPRWPTRCSQCGQGFPDECEWQIFMERLCRRRDTNELMTTRDAPVGAMWDAEYLHPGPQWDPQKPWAWWPGEDGMVLQVKTPGGQWTIDSRASNCTRPNDNDHRCWVRHGTPPDLTVDKNGKTCDAGAGSIQTTNWHGFLRNGELVQ